MAKKHEKWALKIESLKLQLEDIHREIEELRDEKQESFDSKSDKWQESERGEIAQLLIDNLDTIAGQTQSAMDEMEYAIEGLSELE